MIHQVPNQFPSTPSHRKIALVGESPGSTEVRLGKPFVGPAGKLLWALLGRLGVSRETCFVGNLCQTQPPMNKFVDCDPFDLEESLKQLTLDLKVFEPNLVICLGAHPLSYALGRKMSVVKQRGSLFMGNGGGPMDGYKCLSALHPAACLRQPSWIPLLHFDLKRACVESLDPNLELPVREIKVIESTKEFLGSISAWMTLGSTLAIDIEGWPKGAGITCIGFAESPTKAYVLPFLHASWSAEEELEIWEGLKMLLESEKVKKVCHNSLYELFVMAYTHGILIRGLVGDTMMQTWELYCELEKSLQFCASVYTKEPFYKDDRTSTDPKTLHIYNGKDCCVTYEIWGLMNKELKASSLAHYKFNLELVDPVVWMQLRGISKDVEKSRKMLKEEEETIERGHQMLESLVGYKVNPASPKQVAELLYDKMGLPKQFKKDPITGIERVTTDYEALLKLLKTHRNLELECLISLRNHLKKLQYIQMPCDGDQRIRPSHNIVGTETGRMSCSGSSTGSGANLQTIPDDLRCLFVADDGFEMFQVDLAGADGWTVACHAAAQGDHTMLDDLRFGLKPAKLITLAMRHGPDVFRKTRDELKELSETVGGNEQWDYFSSKKVQHGSSYGMMPPMMRTQIFLESEGRVDLSIKDTRTLQDLFWFRYPGIKRWHDWIRRQLTDKGYLLSPSGNLRKFFGLRTAHQTFKEMLAQEPQNNTGYVTNLALLKLWEMQEDELPLEILLQIHDAVLGQIRIDQTSYAIPYIRRAFENPIRIAGIEVCIPFELKVGPNWGCLKEVEK